MHTVFKEAILNCTKADDYYELETIQNLWSGYGRIVRLGLEGSQLDSVVIKHVQLPIRSDHPKGWNGDLSHQRKIKSYHVETTFYKNYSANCGELTRIPKCLAFESCDDEVLIVLEDLDASGYPIRKTTVNWIDLEACISWLANFHARFLGVEPVGLWQIGTYWHLHTRPDELVALKDLGLKNAAQKIDALLNNCQYKTLVHGDAKLANFCFSETPGKVSALDFQYVGGGCGMKDLVYLIGSCFNEADCAKYEARMIDFYFKELQKSLANSAVDFDALETEWREMFPVAWTDFHRFIKGWSPGHWKINDYSEKLAKQVIDRLK